MHDTSGAVTAMDVPCFMSLVNCAHAAPEAELVVVPYWPFEHASHLSQLEAPFFVTNWPVGQR
jgi:hypothetical protein